MTLGDKGNGQGLAAQQVFGPQAAVYATSKVHIRDDSLESVERMVDAANGSNRYGWTVDLGTGAGFTAFAVAGVSDRVIASDVTEPMLRQAQRLGRERGIINLGLSQNAAEALPFADGSIDLVTSRVSAQVAAASSIPACSSASARAFAVTMLQRASTAKTAASMRERASSASALCAAAWACRPPAWSLLRRRDGRLW